MRILSNWTPFHLKDNSAILNIEPPFWFVLDEIVNTYNLNISPLSANFESPQPASQWLAMGIHETVLKTLNLLFQKCKSLRVVSGVR